MQTKMAHRYNIFPPNRRELKVVMSTCACLHILCYPFTRTLTYTSQSIRPTSPHFTRSITYDAVPALTPTSLARLESLVQVSERRLQAVDEALHVRVGREVAHHGTQIVIPDTVPDPEAVRLDGAEPACLHVRGRQRRGGDPEPVEGRPGVLRVELWEGALQFLSQQPQREQMALSARDRASVSTVAGRMVSVRPCLKAEVEQDS